MTIIGTIEEINVTEDKAEVKLTGVKTLLHGRWSEAEDEAALTLPAICQNELQHGGKLIVTITPGLD